MALNMPSSDDNEDYSCELPIYLFEDDEISRAEDCAEKERFRLALTVFPIIAPLAAFASFDVVLGLFHSLNAAFQTWFSVDGGKVEIELITPVINGVVQPAVAIIFSTIVAATLTSLRNRQVAIRASLNKEACDIRTLDAVISNLCACTQAHRAPAFPSLLPPHHERAVGVATEDARP